MLNNNNDKIRDEYYYFSRNYKIFEEVIPEIYVLLYGHKALKNPDNDVYNCARSFINNMSKNDHNDIRADLKQLDDSELKELSVYIANKGIDQTFYYSSLNTDHKLVDLIYALLQIQNGDTIFDLGSGNGSLLAALYERASKEKIRCKALYGIENSNDIACIGYMLLALICDGKSKSDISINDALTTQDYFYNKGYTYAPSGFGYIFRTAEYKSLLYPDITFNVSSQEQWIYIDRLLANLEGNNPRAVALVYGKTLMATNRNEFLQRLLDDGWIEGIIELTEGVVDYPHSKTYLIVFSPNNKKVRFLATDINKEFIAGGWRDDFPENPKILNTPAILHAYFDPNESVLDVSVCDLKVMQNLLPENVLEIKDKPVVDTDFILGEISEIKIGCQYTAKQFDITNEKTGYKILTPSDIEDGTIYCPDLKWVVNNKHLKEDVFLQDGDVVMTTKSTKVKVAVVHLTGDDYKVIATGGMIIIRLNQEMMEPLYLQMFLESDMGQNALKTMQTGGTIINLSPTMLKDLRIPFLDRWKQKLKGNQYWNLLDKIYQGKRDVETKRQQLKEIFLSDDDK